MINEADLPYLVTSAFVNVLRRAIVPFTILTALATDGIECSRTVHGIAVVRT